MTARRSKQPKSGALPTDKEAAIRALREILQQTEVLAAEANLKETAFMIGVARASLSSDPGAENIKKPSIEDCLPGVH